MTVALALADGIAGRALGAGGGAELAGGSQCKQSDPQTSTRTKAARTWIARPATEMLNDISH